MNVFVIIYHHSTGEERFTSKRNPSYSIVSDQKLAARTDGWYDSPQGFLTAQWFTDNPERAKVFTSVTSVRRIFSYGKDKTNTFSRHTVRNIVTGVEMPADDFLAQ